MFFGGHNLGDEAGQSEEDLSTLLYFFQYIKIVHMDEPHEQDNAYVDGWELTTPCIQFSVE